MAATGTRGRRVAAVPDADKPTISLNLDTLEREDVQAEPFSIVVGGRRYLFADILEVSWDALTNAEQDALEFLRLVVAPDDSAEFLAAIGKVPAWKVRELVASYMRHYGMPAPGEGLASPQS